MTDLQSLSSEPRHVVAIFGGAVSGSEAAVVCAERGITAIVFEQNERPYGKIEDGLPRWHDKLRAKEFARIDENLSRDGVLYVPCTKLGRDLDLAELVAGWGLSAVVLANGAWRDRPLPVEGAEQYVGKGLVRQNPFVYWFNHYEEAGYAGEQYEVKPGAVVVGGGLASVDVCKIINLVLYRQALHARGIEVDVVELEHKGIPTICQKHGVDPDELGVNGATLYYRRRVQDMPVAFPKGDSPEALEKAEKVREKMVGILADKYRIRVQDTHSPAGLIVEDGRLVGLEFRRTEVVGGRAKEVPGSEVQVRSELIVSSIGSVPERVLGVPTRGELYDYASWDTGEVTGMPGVYGLGNVLTGKGNIKDSRNNAREISDKLLADYLGIGPDEPDMDGAHDSAQRAAEPIAHSAIRRGKVPVDKLRTIAERVQARWDAVGYDGDYRRWIEAHRP